MQSISDFLLKDAVVVASSGCVPHGWSCCSVLHLVLLHSEFARQPGPSSSASFSPPPMRRLLPASAGS